MFLVQIDTVKCFYCPQKGPSVIPWDSLSPADQTFLWDKHPESGEGASCVFTLHSPVRSSCTESRSQAARRCNLRYNAVSSDFKCATTKRKVSEGHATEILVGCDQWHAVLVRNGSANLLEFLR